MGRPALVPYLTEKHRPFLMDCFHDISPSFALLLREQPRDAWYCRSSNRNGAMAQDLIAQQRIRINLWMVGNVTHVASVISNPPLVALSLSNGSWRQYICVPGLYTRATHL